MKKIVVACIALFITLIHSTGVMAQQKPEVKIASVKQKGKTVDFNLTSSAPFIFGNNRYELYIGDKDFVISKQAEKNGTGVITFLIPAEDFGKLQEGASVFLNYGRMPVKYRKKMDEVAAKSARCWSLGKFSKKLLTK